MKTANQAFIAGWFHGRKYGVWQSVREVMAQHPGLTPELASCYLTGQEDGVSRDTFRLNLIRQAPQGKAIATVNARLFSDLAT